jgi:gliding motility-associated protein GldE
MTTFIPDRRIKRKGFNISIPELSKAIEITSSKAEDEEEQNILKGIINFGDIEVSEIMRSRMDIAAVEDSINFEELLKFVLDAGYSRIPVYRDNLDRIIGILYIKDLLPVMDQSPDYKWTDLLRPAYFVPENKKINDLLKEFREKKIHIAVIVDEYGGTSGLITLEDILEEIVGEIMDESDELGNELLYTRKDENTFIFEGKISLNDFCKIINADESIFDDVRGEADSLAGLLLELEGEIPSKNKEIKYSNFVFTIEAVDKRRIKLIKVHILNDKSS